MGGILDARRRQTEQRLEEVRVRLGDADRAIAGKACVYATGSFARGEASAYSDLDLFIVGRTSTKVKTQRLLKRLDESCLKADLIRLTRALRIPEFSGDGEYLTHYTVADLIAALGTPADDASNTFTARLLLLLESRPLIGREVYEEAVKQTIEAYWRDYEGREGEFIPAFLANDILRLWRTFCVNYEARTRAEPAAEKAKRKLKNFKLKHSRLLTCYSALLWLMHIWTRNHTVTPADAFEMTRMTPTERLERLHRDSQSDRLQESIAELLDRYGQFLKETDYPEKDLIARLQDSEAGPAMFRGASAFGKQMFDTLMLLGDESQFLRMIVV